MKRNVLMFYFLLLFLIQPCFSANNRTVYESKTGSLYNNQDTLYKFTTGVFTARLNDKYDNVRILYQTDECNKEFYLSCDSYIEHLNILKVNEQLFWFKCESLGFTQYFIWDIQADKIYEPFFDMKTQVDIIKIDYEDQVLFGDSWNSDKSLMTDQKVELYLFSTFKKKHFKIAEKYGDTFSLSLIGNHKIQYKDNNGKLTIFDYSAWSKQECFYSASSFLTEGKTKYSPNNLSLQAGLPWASANGYGIGDTITVTIPGDYNLKLCFYNGFQSESRLDLYKANSRLKKIEIKCRQKDTVFSVELKDVKDKQIVDLSRLEMLTGPYVEIEIKILEVYPGDKYKDLCIQAIIPEY